MARTLANDIRLVIVQFAYTNENLMPEGIGIKNETIEQFVAKSSAVRGERVIDPTPDLSLQFFVPDLAEVGHELVDAFSRRQSKNGRPFLTTRYTFSGHDHAHSSEVFLAKKDIAMSGLVKFVTEGTWEGQVYLNPLFCEGQMVPDAYALSVNLHARVPLFDATGKPMVRWQRDEAGEKVGEAPLILKPPRFLRVEDGGVCVVEE